ncbi:MAG: DUF4340 domain-containing protein [Clostridiales bacterium]|nr:DUF4340 domain-containing protein [Clostridiales bacterium]
MKELKKLCILVSVFGALVVILLGVLIARHVKKQRLDDKNDDHTVHYAELQDLKSLTVEGPEGDTTIFRFDAAQKISSVSHNGTDFESSKLNASEIEGAVSTLLHFSLSNRFEPEGGDVGKYGFSNVQYRIVADKTDGSQSSVDVGDLLGDKSGVYAMVSGSSEVLVADYGLYQCLTRDFEDYLDRYIFNYERVEINEISFENRSTGDAWTVKVQPDNDTGVFLEPDYDCTYPMQREPNNTMINLLEAIRQFRVSQYIPIAEENYAAYGLDDPQYLIHLHLMSGETVDVSLSMEISGYYYGFSSNNPYTFCVEPSNLPGLTMRSFDLIDSYVIHGYLNDVTTVEVTVKDHTFIIDCMLNESYDFYSDDSVFQLDKRNAKVYDSNGECYGLLLFGSIFNMPVSRVDYDVNPDLSDVEATIKVNRLTSEITTLKLVPCGDHEFYCFINDYYSGFIVDRSVLYKDNGHEMSGFGVWDAYLLATEAIDNKSASDVYDRP